MAKTHHKHIGTPVHHQLAAREAAARLEASGNDRDQDANKIDPAGTAGLGDDPAHDRAQPQFTPPQVK